MTDRILDLSEHPASLHAHNGLLVLKRDDADDMTVPMDELAAVVVSNRQVSFTLSVLADLAAAGVLLVVCDRRHMPTGMLLPLDDHHVQAERFALQINASVPTRKRLWRQVVRVKIRAQAALLEQLNGSDSGLGTLISKVRSGDPTNVEAQAARRYWPALFGKQFRRNYQGEDFNRHLNYGYAVVRAVTARGICGSGLHPTLGLHHKNRYNSFALADDLMEPFRPLVDRAVHRLVAERGPEAELDRDAKAAILGALTGRYACDDEVRSLFDILSRVASSLAAVFDGRRKDLLMPNLLSADK